MDFKPNEQEIVDKINGEDNYINYVSRLFFNCRSLSKVSSKLNVDLDFFDRLFASNPELEDSFNDELKVIADRAASRVNSLALPMGLKKVSDIIEGVGFDEGTIDNRLILQAAALQLQFYLKRKNKKESSGDSAIDEIFRKLQKETDGKQG